MNNQKVWNWNILKYWSILKYSPFSKDASCTCGAQYMKGCLACLCETSLPLLNKTNNNPSKKFFVEKLRTDCIRSRKKGVRLASGAFMTLSGGGLWWYCHVHQPFGLIVEGFGWLMWSRNQSHRVIGCSSCNRDPIAFHNYLVILLTDFSLSFRTSWCACGSGSFDCFGSTWLCFLFFVHQVMLQIKILLNSMLASHDQS